MAPDRTTGRDPPQRREARFAKRRCSLHPGGLLPGCQERRPQRDRGGATGTVAASQGFASGMEARQGGDSSTGSVHDSSPRQGDARERHRQKKNKTDWNQGSSNQNQNRRKKRIITGKVMLFPTDHKQRRRGKRTSAAGARSSPFPEGNRLPGSLVAHARTMPARRKGPPANQQPLYKGASVQSDQHHP
ncbi:hypothetical protein [Escherichia coli]|uniref:hypothetical protein n=1 Tax=Escherichia coli TaxID=562 RepID=UPI0010EB5C3B|nr:hypothetical protein HmCmsJML243_04199 [Escherichia coli]